MSTAKEELVALIEAKGKEIRTLKSDGTPKDALKPHIDELLMLKAKFQTITGEAYVAPGQEKKSKPSKVPPEPTAEGAEPVDPNKKSKKQLQREKKEAEKAAAKAKAKEERERKQAEAAAKGAVGEMYVTRSARGDGPLGHYAIFVFECTCLWYLQPHSILYLSLCRIWHWTFVSQPNSLSNAYCFRWIVRMALLLTSNYVPVWEEITPTNISDHVVMLRFAATSCFHSQSSSNIIILLNDNITFAEDITLICSIRWDMLLTSVTDASRSTPEGQEWRYGHLPLIQSTEMTGKRFTPIEQLTAEKAGQEVRLRVRVHASRSVPPIITTVSARFERVSLRDTRRYLVSVGCVT